jgi:uncharacterized protein (TIGR02147 family)
MSLFNHSDYRNFLRSYVENLPRKGRGELSRISAHLQINTSLLSQILAGSRDFTLEQGLELSRFLGHSELEAEYLENLILLARAGTESYKKRIRGRMAKLKREAFQLNRRMPVASRLNEEQLAVFCSSWVYSAIHLVSSLVDEKGKSSGLTVAEIAQRVRLPRPKLLEHLSFLCQAGLCVQEGERYRMGEQSTFVERQSPHLARLHSNWRLKAIHDFEQRREEDFMFTAQMSLSQQDFLKIREKLMALVKETNASVQASAAEEVACLSIDWFGVR